MKHAYQVFLLEEFQRRRGRNRGYSLRAYARDLEIPAPKLSQYLNSISGPSEERAEILSKKLNLSPLEAELFITSSKARGARNPDIKKSAKNKIKSLMTGAFTAVNMDKFAVIRDWYHMAILELTAVKGFSPKVEWISESLNLRPEQTREALERLDKLGFLNRSEQTWKLTQGDFETPPDFSARAIREFHKQILELAAQKIDSTELHEREFGALNCAIDQELVPEMKSLIRNFLREASALSKKSKKNKNAVYVLSTQFFPVYKENL